MRPLCAATLLLVLGGYTAGDPITPPSPVDVEGLYAVAEFRFTPHATAVEPADVHQRLVLAATSLELFGSGAALLRFRLKGRPSDLVAGEFDVSATQVWLRLSDPNGRLVPLLMSPTLIFDRLAGDVLWHERAATVNLAAFDPERYTGLNQVPGILRLPFVPVGWDVTTPLGG